VDIVYHKGQRRAKGRTHYVLRRPLESGTEPIPLAIIEAKRKGLPPKHGLQQDKGYRVGNPLRPMKQPFPAPKGHDPSAKGNALETRRVAQPSPEGATFP
jgi:hypothetical protein